MRSLISTIVLLPTIPLLLTPNNLIFASASGNTDEWFCGTSWPDANSNCHAHCPTGEDAECVDSMGEGYGCFYFTGCDHRNSGNGNGGGNNGNGSGNSATTNNNAEEDNAISTPINNNYCGKTWIHAMLSCSASCPLGFECSNPLDTCFAATSCDKPMAQLLSQIAATMAGPDTVMDGTDMGIFGDVIWEQIAAVAEELGVSVGVEVGDQVLVGRRELQRRIKHRQLVSGGDNNERYMHWNITEMNVRRLPSGSSAIDVSMVVTGDYRPPPYVDLDVIAEDSINRNGQKVVNTLRERGSRAGRDFFSRVEGIEAVRMDQKTERPTVSPQRSPTWSPIGPPTSVPSGEPTYSPSDFPSSAPSRALDQVIMTGSREDLQIGGETTSSYGYLFNIRTKPDAGVAIITGFDFYTLSTDEVTFELWSRLGSFQDFKGTYDGWDLIAEGTVKGRGVGRYTSIPPETYTPVSINGGGGEDGTRAFYITLNSIDLVYKLGAKGDGIPASDAKSHAETDDIEIWEGEGVLFYPFPDPADTFFYRYPRQYLGAVYYDRLPCRPFSSYGVQKDLPCPELPTGSPTVPPPTTSPVPPPTISPSKSPVVEPTRSPSTEPTRKPVEGQTPAPATPTDMPTVSPTESKMPTERPTTGEPTLSPIVPQRSYIITTLRNVPERSMTDREGEKYIEILTKFLQRHTGGSMTVAGIDVWHQEITMMDAAEGYVAQEEDESTGPQVAKRGAAKQRRHLQRKKRPEEEIPQVHAMEITLILLVSLSNLPTNLLGNMANVAIQEHEQELLDLLHEQQAFYTFFRETDGIFSRTLDQDKLTSPPSLSPTTTGYRLAMEAAREAALLGDLEEEEDTGIGFGVYVGLGVGLIWCCLTGISIAYLMGARGEMEEQRDMENLLKAEKNDPLKSADGDDDDAVSGKDGEKLRRSSTVPLGNDDPDDLKETDSDESELWDHTQNPRLSNRTRIEITKSMKAIDSNEVGDEASETWDHTKNSRLSGRAQSMIATTSESKAVLNEVGATATPQRKTFGANDRSQSMPMDISDRSGRKGGGMKDISDRSGSKGRASMKDISDRSGTKRGGSELRQKRAMAQSMVAGSKRDMSTLHRASVRNPGGARSSMRLSSNSHGSGGNLASMRMSSASMRMSSTSMNSDGANESPLKRSANRGSSASMRRPGSSDNLVRQSTSRLGGSGSSGDLRASRVNTGAGLRQSTRRNIAEDLRSSRVRDDLRSSRVQGDQSTRGEPPFRRQSSDIETRQPTRRRSGTHGNSMT